MEHVVPDINDCPVVMTIIFLCCTIWLYQRYHEVDLQKVRIDYTRIVDHYEWWRIVTGALSHVSLLHMVFNLLCLWVLRSHETQLGSMLYLELTFLLFFHSSITLIFVYFFQQRYWDRTESVVGYSGVLYGLISFECVLHSGAMFFFGYRVPYYLGPFLILALDQGIGMLMKQKVSLTGHLSGMVWGFICGSIFTHYKFHPSGLPIPGAWPLEQPHEVAIDVWFCVSFLAFIMLMIYSVWKSDPFGINKRVTVGDDVQNDIV